MWPMTHVYENSRRPRAAGSECELLWISISGRTEWLTAMQEHCFTDGFFPPLGSTPKIQQKAMISAALVTRNVRMGWDYGVTGCLIIYFYHSIFNWTDWVKHCCICKAMLKIWSLIVFFITSFITSHLIQLDWVWVFCIHSPGNALVLLSEISVWNCFNSKHRTFAGTKIQDARMIFLLDLSVE